MITLGQTAYQPSTRMPPTSGRWAGWDWTTLYQGVLTAIQYPVSTLNYVRALDYITNLPKIMVFNYPVLLAAWVRFTKLYPTHNHAAALRYMEALLRATGRFQDTEDKAKWWMIEQEWQSLEGAAPQVRGLSGFPFGAAGRTRIVQSYPGITPPRRAPSGYAWRRSGTRWIMVKLPRPAPRGYRPKRLSIRKPVRQVTRRRAVAIRPRVTRPRVTRPRVTRPRVTRPRLVTRRAVRQPIKWMTWPIRPIRRTAPRPPAMPQPPRPPTMPEPQPPPMPAGLGQTLPYIPERYPGKIILPVIIPPPPSLYPGAPTQLRKRHKLLAWIGFLGLVLLHKEASPLSLLSGTRIKKNGLGSLDRLSRLSDPSPMMSKDWIAAQIRKAVEQDPGRRVHGDTRYNAFFITPEREIVPFDMLNTLEGTTPAMDTISVHSHSGNNWRQFVKRTGNLEPFNPLNDVDIQAFQQMVLRGIANTDVLIMADGRMEVLHVPPESEKNFTSLQPPEFGILRPTYDYYASVYRRTGKQAHEVDKQLVREFADRYNLVYYDDNWLPPEPEPLVKEKPSGIRRTFKKEPFKVTKTKRYYTSPFYVEPGVYPGIPEQMEIWRERPPVQQTLLGRDQ